MSRFPRLVSVVAVALGCYDVIRALAHTAFLGYAASDLAGLDLTGPTGRDQLVLLAAFGASNFVTAAALLFVGLTSRVGSVILLAVMPAAYIVAGISLEAWGAGLVGQGVFPGTENMRVYLATCLLTVAAALIWTLRSRWSGQAASA